MRENEGRRDARTTMPDGANRHETLLRLLLHAYPDRVTVRRESDASRAGPTAAGERGAEAVLCVMVGGRGIVLEPASVVRRARLFLSLDPREPPAAGAAPRGPGVDRGAGGGSGRMHAGARPARGAARTEPCSTPNQARVSLASAVREEWLEELFPYLVERRLEHRFDPEKARVVATRFVLFAGLPLREAAAEVDRDRAGEVLRDHLLPQALVFAASDEGLARWLARVAFLRRHMPELRLPEIGAELLGAALGQACTRRVRVEEALWHSLRRQSLDPRQRAALDKEAPETLSVPSGSRIRLAYPPDGGAPTLAVRIQEVFGWTDTPRVAAGRVAAVLQLLGPNHRPVQTTSDLRSFWSGAYGAVRRELRARYPRHRWPENPEGQRTKDEEPRSKDERRKTKDDGRRTKDER
jgi:ATP-dependent helicase HrpB